jgi:hypothetical protein
VKSGVAGTCETAGYCSFPDPSCASGRRFEPNAGGGLANQCATGAVIDAPLADSHPDVPATPIAFVQANAVKSGAQTTAAVAFMQAVTAHDAIVLEVDDNGPGAVTVTDSLGSTYEPMVGPVTNSGFRLTIFAAFDVRAGSDTITVTFSAAPATESHLYAHEYAGLVAFDVGAGATGTSAATDGVASGFITTRYANELLFAYSQTGVVVAGTGFTARSTFDSNVSEDQLIPTVGTYQATATMTSGSSWTIVAGAFRGF